MKLSPKESKIIMRGSPDEVAETVQKAMVEAIGDPPAAVLVSPGHGYFFVRIRLASHVTINDPFWALELRRGIHLRRVSLKLAIRAVRGEMLTQ